MRDFSAPWSTSLKVMTAISVAILAGLPLVGVTTGPREEPIWQIAMIGLPLSILLGALPFMVRGYHVENSVLTVRRLGWSSRIPLDGLETAEVDPEAMKGSIRTFGNGGLFCFAGRFRNARLGTYRAWATDPTLAVVLKFPDRTLVVSPDRPDRFVEAIRKASPT